MTQSPTYPFITKDEFLSLIGPQTTAKAKMIYEKRLKEMGLNYDNSQHSFYKILVLILNNRVYGWIDKIIERGFDPESIINRDNWRLLNLALQHDNPVYTESLLSRYHLNVNALNKKSETALSQAASMTDTASFELLLKHNPKVNHINLEGQHLGLTIVLKQFHTSGLPLLERIKSFGFNLWFNKNETGQTMLSIALNKAQPEYVKYIVEQAKTKEDMALIETETNKFFSRLNEKDRSYPWVGELQDFLKIQKEQKLLNINLPVLVPTLKPEDAQKIVIRKI